MNNQDKFVNAFAEALNIDQSKINEELKYQGIEQWDSIAHMVLISHLEAAFDISLETEDVLDLSSFAKAKEIVAKYGVIL